MLIQLVQEAAQMLLCYAYTLGQHPIVQFTIQKSLQDTLAGCRQQSSQVRPFQPRLIGQNADMFIFIPFSWIHLLDSCSLWQS